MNVRPTAFTMEVLPSIRRLADGNDSDVDLCRDSGEAHSRRAFQSSASFPSIYYNGRLLKQRKNFVLLSPLWLMLGETNAPLHFNKLTNLGSLSWCCAAPDFHFLEGPTF